MRVLAPHDRFEQYIVDGVAGHGGSATVYRAHEAAHPARQVALKVLDEHAREPSNLDRIQREFAFAKRLAHPHVVAVYEHGPGWLSMELLDGGVRGLTDRGDVLTALRQVADALDYAHAMGIVHCDVKPANVLTAPDFFARGGGFPGRSARGAVLIDFGSARALSEGPSQHRRRIEASLPYTSPEVLRGHPPTAATDEYALACTAIELLTGAPPFIATTTMGLIDNHLNSPVPRYSRDIDWIPRAFDSMLAKAMAKDPDGRYDSCAEFVAMISRALTAN